ncbi:DNA mismatch repair enzyme [Pelotomaculum thermopropionicum SI]|uniref:DNA mismatch repair protein MutL n=1 Tax=Pelotomaculum thermopropionicum (strain DSM 13744 / JCM 10971 / SI) TaxID=370438 RepID=MUTL_PELTS|nr:RecName: Full=DNA mismatch repair protein MutL [Pelotomaculum thermopropionicum SI]BAF59523.1 DNA mismatch repair enzyme [Pelotomaculum thermopropionicum SI]
MANIIILDEFTAGQIAAGEVVERPVSVVKELVENSIDAGAGRIVVELEGGGLQAISVLDDGCGMSEEDLVLAFQRHATSKIKCSDDLNRITTLGFRGEALPSIAAVSKITVATRTRDALAGTRAEFAGGELIGKGPIGCPPGTSITVRDLFYNTPARRKAMKAPSAEGALCGGLISRLALARPEICFEVGIKGRRVFYSPGSGNLIDSLAAVYGRQIAAEMIAVKAVAEGLSINGYLGKPSLSRSTRSHITVIINGRYVRCPAIAEAIEGAYGTLLSRGRRPVAVLSLSVSPELLDVNIHPAKLEVRLLEEEKTASLLAGILKDALADKAVIPSAGNFRQAALRLENNKPGAEIFDGLGAGIIKTPGGGSSDRHVPGDKKNIQECLTLPDAHEYVADRVWVREAEDTPAYGNKVEKLPVLNALAHFPPVYILAGGEDGLYIVDQHAAHERIIYEEILSSGRTRPSQYLLVPVMLELDYREASILIERIIWFTDAGFVIEHFGGNTFLLRGVPFELPAGQEREIILDLLDYFESKGTGAGMTDFFKWAAASIACRSAVRAGEKLSLPSMNALLQRLSGTASPYTCPHGRPVVIKLSFRELELRFRR